MSIFSELTRRRLIQITLAYIAGAWVLVEMSGFLVDTYDLSRKVVDTTLLLAVLGFPAALVIGWFHGERGHQEIQRSEAWMLATLGVLAAVGTFQIATGEPLPAGDEIQTVAEPSGNGTLASAPTEAAGRAQGERLGMGSVAVFPFTNRVTDPELDWLGPGLADLLTTNLAQIEPVEVVGRQRLFDLLTEAGRSEGDVIPDHMATEVARSSGARRMIRGTVIGTADSLAVDVQLIDIESGTVVAAERVRGSDVFAIVDTLSARLTPHMQPDRPAPDRTYRASWNVMAEAGSRNRSAVRAFHKGVEAERAGQPELARRMFQQAVRADSGHALALLRLSDLMESDDLAEAEYLREMASREIADLPPEVRLRFERIEEALGLPMRIDSMVQRALRGRPPPRPGDPPDR